MIKYSEFTGKSVYCENGKKAGYVKDVFFHLDSLDFAGLKAEKKGITILTRHVLKEHIMRIEKDTVFITKATCMKVISGNEFKKKYICASELRGSSIISKTGKELGFTDDIFFNLDNGRIDGLVVSDGMYEDVVHGRKLLPFAGKVEFSGEFFVIDKDSEDEMMESKKGLKTMFDLEKSQELRKE